METLFFKNNPILSNTAVIGGPCEGKGPLAKYFDDILPTIWEDSASFEKEEQALLERTCRLALAKAGLGSEQVDFFIAGDLMNQIISSSFTARQLAIPYWGIFGACATSMEGLALAALLVDSGHAEKVLTATVSHNCTVEKQFRYPTEYGAQKPDIAQFTVTAAGAGIISSSGQGVKITAATIGKAVDLGINDPYNMGAAMAPAAAATIIAHLKNTALQWDDYDVIITGDLGKVGQAIALELLHQARVPIDSARFLDCGRLMFAPNQPVFAGGSGAGCSAGVVYSYFFHQLSEHKLKKILVVATGALLSPLSYQQGRSIPGIAHAVSLEG